MRAVAAALAAIVLSGFLAGPADASAGRAARPPAVCSSTSHGALAARISRDIQAARRGRVSAVAVEVDDPGTGLVSGSTAAGISTPPAW